MTFTLTSTPKNKVEAKRTTEFLGWYKRQKFRPFPAGPIEVKVVRKNRLYLKQFAKHQIHALRIAKHGLLAWKIPDAGWQNPFDVMMYDRHKYAWAVVFLSPTSKEFVVIDIDVLLEKIKTGQVSLLVSELKSFPCFSL